MFSIRCGCECECEKCVNSRHTEGSALARRRFFYCLASVRDIGTCSGCGARRYGTDCQLLAWKRAKYLNGSRAKIRMLCRRSMKRERKPRCCAATLKRTVPQASELSLMQCQAYSRTALTELVQQTVSTRRATTRVKWERIWLQKLSQQAFFCEEVTTAPFSQFRRIMRNWQRFNLCGWKHILGELSLIKGLAIHVMHVPHLITHQ